MAHKVLRERDLTLEWRIGPNLDQVQYFFGNGVGGKAKPRNNLTLPLTDRSFDIEISNAQSAAANQALTARLAWSSREKRAFQEQARRTYQVVCLLRDLRDTVKQDHPHLFRAY